MDADSFFQHAAGRNAAAEDRREIRNTLRALGNLLKVTQLKKMLRWASHTLGVRVQWFWHIVQAAFNPHLPSGGRPAGQWQETELLSIVGNLGQISGLQ